MTIKPTQWMLIGFSGIVVYLMVTSAKKAAGGTTQPAALPPGYSQATYTPPASSSASTPTLSQAYSEDVQAQTLADVGNAAANTGVTSGEWLNQGWPRSTS